jgi:purine-binding chemotaxis protein CheW
MDLATLVLFTVDGTVFALPVEAVERVMRWAEPEGDPALPAWIEGVLCFADRTLAVVDLNKRFSTAPREHSAAARSAHTRTLILKLGSLWVAAIVDAVLEVATIDAAGIEALRLAAGEPAVPVVLGVCERKGQRVVVLDTARLFTSDERALLGALVPHRSVA